MHLLNNKARDECNTDKVNYIPQYYGHIEIQKNVLAPTLPKLPTGLDSSSFPRFSFSAQSVNTSRKIFIFSLFM